MDHALVMEDANVSRLLEKKGVNVDNHLMLLGRGRVEKVKTCLDLPQLSASSQIATWS
jgi:hypothetical protein